MRIGVPKESKPGERRVAATPKTVEQIVKLGYDVSIESGAGVGASFDDAAYRAAGADVVGRRGVGPPTLILKINAPSDDEVQRLQSGQTLVSLLAPALDPDLVAALVGPRGHRPGHGRGPAHLARPVPGRAELDGQHRRLPRRDRGGQRVRVVLHRPGHRRGQGPAGQGPGRRRRRRGAGGDRHGEQPGRDRARLRRPLRGRRAGRVDGRGVPADRGGGHRAQRDRLRQGDGRGLQPQGRRDVRRAGQGRRHRHHHRAHPRPAGTPPADRGDGRLDEAGQRGRRHGRRQRRQRRRQPARRARGHRERRGHPRLHRPPRAAAHPGLPALRHQPREPAQADDPGEGRAGSCSTSTTSSSAA